MDQTSELHNGLSSIYGYTLTVLLKAVAGLQITAKLLRHQTKLMQNDILLALLQNLDAFILSLEVG
jgi:hypothetical protein